jgi:hypothetical protein
MFADKDQRVAGGKSEEISFDLGYGELLKFGTIKAV